MDSLNSSPATEPSSAAAASPHRRRPRYAGKHPRRFEDKYKEHGRDTETISKVLAAGKTPAGTHRPILVTEILEVLRPAPGEVAVDCTLGYGGHSQELLGRLAPGGKLLGLDVDPMELPKTISRLRALGYDETVFTAHQSNFAGLPQVLAAQALAGADVILADLGISSMQIDNPARGFSVKADGPLDLRLNPERGQSGSALLRKIKADSLAELLIANADEPHAVRLASALAGKEIATTLQLAQAVRAALPPMGMADADLSVRRVFQALRVAVNDEFSALETLLRNLPQCLNPGGRVAILTFHSGEDRRVKKSFEANFNRGLYSEIAREVVRPTSAEQFSNPRSAPAKLRWACRA